MQIAYSCKYYNLIVSRKTFIIVSRETFLFSVNTVKYEVINMINETNLLNFYCSGIYDSTKALTETEIIMKVLEKLNLVILNFNDLECQLMKRMTALEKDVNYYLDTGIKLEVEKQLNKMIEDGTIKTIINEVIIENYS